MTLGLLSAWHRPHGPLIGNGEAAAARLFGL